VDLERFRNFVNLPPRMNRFSIKDMENLSGIKAHTLRIWEQRYGIITPKRKDSNHRFYDGDDLKNLLRISLLYHNGLKISKIAKLKINELIDLTVKNAATEHAPELLIHQLVEAAIDLDEIRFESLLNKAILENGFEDAVLKIIYPYLEKVGILWMSDVAIPAQEHFSSCIIQRKMLVAIDGLPQPQVQENNYRLMFTPEGEYHELPLLLAHYMIKKAGKHIIYGGANVPMKDLKYICDNKPVKELYFHLITYLRNNDPDEYIAELSTAFPSVKIYVSGPATKMITAEPTNVTLFRSLEDMLQFLRK
jgi:DNA-binding transcriptional MerR regulator